ncbi:MAG: hypothetical protein V5A79_02120, partial [Candidatus Bipolaricaulota bacterium]
SNEENIMLPDEHLNVLKKLYNKIHDRDINWVVTGSVSFCLQGVPLSPNDIDIQTDEDGAYKIEDLFRDRVIKEVKFSSTDKIRSHFGALMIHGIVVELMGGVQKYYDGEWEDPIDIDLHKKTVAIAGMKVPVLELSYEAEAYRRFGRVEMANKLKTYAEK